MAFIFLPWNPKFRLCFLLTILSLPAISQPVMKEGYAPTGDTAKLYYRVYGTSGDTIMFLHGGPGGNLETPIETHLALADKHVLIAYDQRGGGRSVENDTTKLNLATHVRDLETLRKFLNINKMAILGHSWGGTLALYYARLYPQHVSKLILHGPMPPAKTPYDTERDEAYQKALNALCRSRAEAANAPDVNAFIEECRKTRFISWWVQLYDTANMKLDVGRIKRAASGIPGLNQLSVQSTLRSLGNWDFRSVMKEVKIPTLIMNGTSAWPPVEHLRIWASTMPDARLLLIPKSGHETAQFENPQFFFTAIDTFLSSKWPVEAQVIK